MKSTVKSMLIFVATLTFVAIAVVCAVLFANSIGLFNEAVNATEQMLEAGYCRWSHIVIYLGAAIFEGFGIIFNTVLAYLVFSLERDM